MGDLSTVPSAGPQPRLLIWLHRCENGLLVLALALMVLLGVADLTLWQKLRLPVRVPGSESFIRHLSLIVGMVGGMIAARESRLLAMSGLAPFLPARIKRWMQFGSGVVACAITAGLTAAAIQFVAQEREAGLRLALGIPVWWAQVFLPLGFGVIAVRLLWQSAATWRWRLLAFALVAVAVGFAAKPPLDPARLVWPFVGLLLAATLGGAPIFVTLGGAALILFWGQGAPLFSITLDHYDQVTNPLLATLPLFTLAGYLLAESQASARLVRLFSAWTGFVRGGPAIVVALACAFFTTFTGGSGVTILALGGLLMPVLLAARYDEQTALGLITSAGALGILFPPCLPLIIYSIVGQVSMNDMFLGGLLPGLLMVGLTIAYGVWKGPKLSAEERRFNLGEAWRATWAAKWEIVLPVIPLVLIFGGIALPVPAAAATACYAFITQALIHRELKLTSSLPKVVVECGLLVGGVLLILGTAMGFTNYLITQHIPDHAATWISTAISSKLLFLLALNLLLIIVGCLMDIFSATVVIVPLIVPMAAVFGIHPVHLGIIFLANLELGYLTPPVGLNLFLSSYRFGKPVMYVARAALPMMVVRLFGVLLITYVPAITTWLPGLFGGN
jgi:tripartite ATP-independent transporter DctM subunit